MYRFESHEMEKQTQSVPTCETNFYSFGKVRLTDLGFLYDGKDNAKETGNAKHFDSSVFHLHLFFWGMFLMLP